MNLYCIVAAEEWQESGNRERGEWHVANGHRLDSNPRPLWQELSFRTWGTHCAEFSFSFLPRPDLDGDNESYVRSITFSVWLPAVITAAESVDGASKVKRRYDRIAYWCLLLKAQFILLTWGCNLSGLKVNRIQNNCCRRKKLSWINLFPHHTFEWMCRW